MDIRSLLNPSSEADQYIDAQGHLWREVIPIEDLRAVLLDDNECQTSEPPSPMRLPEAIQTIPSNATACVDIDRTNYDYASAWKQCYDPYPTPDASPILSPKDIYPTLSYARKEPLDTSRRNDKLPIIPEEQPELQIWAMRLTPQCSQYEVESSSPESLALESARPTQTKRVKEDIPPKLSPLDFAKELEERLEDMVSEVFKASDEIDAKRRDSASGEQTLDDELLDSADGGRPKSIDATQLPLRGTPKPEAGPAKSEPPMSTQNAHNDRGIIEDESGSKQPNEVVEVLVEGEPRDLCQAPSLTQLDTRLRTGLTSFVLLAPSPERPGPVRRALVTRSANSSKQSTGEGDSFVENSEQRDAMVDRQTSFPSTQVVATTLMEALDEVDEMNTEEVAAPVPPETVEMEEPANTSTVDFNASISELISPYLAGTPRQESLHAESLPSDIVAVAETPQGADAACQADFMPWPCAALGCQRQSERSAIRLCKVERHRVIGDCTVAHSGTRLVAEGCRFCWDCRLKNKAEKSRLKKRRREEAANSESVCKKRKLLDSAGVNEDTEAASPNCPVLTPDICDAAKELYQQYHIVDTNDRPAVGVDALEAPASPKMRHRQLVDNTPQSGALRITEDDAVERETCHARRGAISAASGGPPRELLLTTPVQLEHTSRERFDSSELPRRNLLGDFHKVRRLIATTQSRSRTPLADITNRVIGHSSSTVRYASHTPSPLRSVHAVESTPPTSPLPGSPTPSRSVDLLDSLEEALQSSSVEVKATEPATTAESSESGSPATTSSEAYGEALLEASIFAAFKCRDEQTSVHLHFCACGRGVTRFPERFPCKQCMNEEYWQELAEDQNRNEVEATSTSMSDCDSSPYAADLCYSCRQLVAYDEHGLCIPCANPLVSGMRYAMKKVRRAKNRRSGFENDKRKPLRGILKSS